jgi:single stranded DNA-binding protein
MIDFEYEELNYKNLPERYKEQLFTINKTILLGRVSSTPTVRYSKAGAKFVYIQVMTIRQYYCEIIKDKKRVETFHNVTLLENCADFACDYCEMGDLVYIEGYLTNREYEDFRYKPKVVKYIKTDVTVNSYTGRIAIITKAKNVGHAKDTEAYKLDKYIEKTKNNQLETEKVDAEDLSLEENENTVVMPTPYKD